MSIKRDWALYYASLCWRVFPIRNGSKDGQLLKSWKNEASNDAATVGAWWDRWPDANIGLATGSGIVVIDADAPAHSKDGNGPDGIRNLIDWQNTNGAFPGTRIARTPSGGLHYYFNITTDAKNRNGILQGVDVRGNGGYVVLPPSTIGETAYTWIDANTPIAYANEAVLSFLNTGASDKKPFTLPEQIPEGHRVTALVSFIGAQKNIGVDSETIRLIVDSVNNRLCNPPLTQEELERTVYTAINRDWKAGANAYTMQYTAAEDFAQVVPVTNEKPPAAAFHKFTQNGKPQDTLDGAIEDYTTQALAMFIQNGKPRVYSGGCYRLDEYGKEIKGFIRSLILPELVTSTRINRIYNLFLDDKRINRDNGAVNQYPAHWINFTNGMLDTMTGQLYPHDPKYYAINQIPHAYDPGAVFEGTVADRFFRGLIPDDNDRNMFFAYIGYCMTTDTRFQKFLVLLGAPGVGKSTANNVIADMIGEENISGMPMQDLNERFMPAVLLGKLLNVCSDIPGTSMDQTSAIKLITGEDPIKGEYKHGAIFTFRNYAKLLFSANEMPSVLSENPEAFYRRLMVIEITHKGPEIRNLQEGLKASIPGLIVRCVTELQKHYILSLPLDSPNSKAAVDVLKTESDSVRGFFAECLEQDTRGRIAQAILYDRYQAYCWANQWRPKSKSRLFSAFRAMGYDNKKSNGERCFYGISFKVAKGTTGTT